MTLINKWRLIVGSSFFLLAVGVALIYKPLLVPEKLIIADADQIVFSLLYVADAQGYFKEEGVEVEYKQFASGKDVLNSVLSGESDVATVFSTPVILAVLSGQPVKVLSTLHRSAKNTAIVARRDCNIERIADLRGKHIGVTRNTNADFMLSVTLDSEGIPDNEVRISDIPPQRIAAALKSGEVDAIATWSPHVAKARVGLSSQATVTLTTPLYTEYSLLATTASHIEPKKLALQRLMRALVRAETYIANNNRESLDIVIKHLATQSPDLLVEPWKNTRFTLSIDNALLESMRLEAEWFTQHGKSAKKELSLKTIIDSSFLQHIKPQGVLVREEP